MLNASHEAINKVLVLLWNGKHWYASFWKKMRGLPKERLVSVNVLFIFNEETVAWNTYQVMHNYKISASNFRYQYFAFNLF